MSNKLKTRLKEVAREDLVMFINACITCTGQKEFYDDAYGQKVSIDFLHEYILGNYRLLYARSLAAGINHFNQAQIIINLLATGKKILPQYKEEEGALIAATLNKLPPQRAWRLLQQLRNKRINNRRSRAIIRDYIAQRSDINFQALKYRSKLRTIISHAHLKLSGELNNFLFHKWKQREYKTDLFENYRQAHFSAAAVYKLPFTIAEGLAIKHKIPRELFLSRIQERMTLGEKLRFQDTAERNKTEINLDFSRLPLTKLALYILSLPLKTREKERQKLEEALKKSASFTLKKSPLKLGKVAAVLDCSYSSSGSSEKRRRPLGIALATHYLLKAASTHCRSFWTSHIQDALLVTSQGQTDLATPLLDALEWNPELIVIVSDGCENDPPQGVAEIIRVFRRNIDPDYKTSIIHCNPVFNSDDFSLRTLSNNAPTVGLRNAEDLPTMLNFARFAEGSASLSELEEYLSERVKGILEKQ